MKWIRKKEKRGLFRETQLYLDSQKGKRVWTLEEKVEETMPLNNLVFLPLCHIEFLRENNLGTLELEGILEIISLSPIIIQLGE